MNSRPIAIDLFAGAGGLSLGLEQAGFDVAVAVEIDPVHASVHAYNFPECTVLAKSVSDVTSSDLSKYIAHGSLDLIAGGAPCQGFSMIGQRALDDPRNNLVKEFIRLVTDLQPKYFLFENVKGLTVGKHKHFLKEVVRSLESAGYNLVLPWKVLNAKKYGVPQSRERLFLLGARKGLELPSYPPCVDETVSCREALEDLPDVEIFDELIKSDSMAFSFSEATSAYAAMLRCTSPFAWKMGSRREWDLGLLSASLRTNHTEITRKRFADTEPGSVEPVSRFFRLPADGVSNTLRAGTDSARGAFTSPRPIHYKYARCVTVREMARLHGFPDWFRFHETKWHGARQIGNAVPPPLAYAIASMIVQKLGPLPGPPKKKLDLGQSFLLKMDMSKASKYWGIQNPIAKRNCKSGLKKRTQIEVEAARSKCGVLNV